VTPDMAFECLLVSRDPNVVSPLNRVLNTLSISTKICLSASKALHEVEGNADLVVIDWVEECASELLKEIRRSNTIRHKTVVVVSAAGQLLPGTHMVLKKPVTVDSGARGMKLVYAQMLQDHRRHARYAVMAPVLARTADGRVIPITVRDIGEGGIGIATRELLSKDDVLSLYLSLPNARKQIYIEARILWTRNYGIGGCEFLRIPPVDREILQDWLKSKCRVKKPLVSI
jgi:hypothetical protein